jgi:hypothetical protein
MDLLREIEGLVLSKLRLIDSSISLIKLESKLAGLSIFPLLVNIVLLLVITLTTSITFMLLIGYFALLIFNNILIAILSILVLNGLLCLCLIKYLSFNLKSMSFEKTRKHLLSDET